MPNPSATRRRLISAYYASLKLLCPGLRNSQFAYREALQESVRPGIRWLDLGCGHQLFPDWMPDALSSQLDLVDRCTAAVGVDAADLRPHSVGLKKVAADVEQLPFADETFSLVTANMVVEHVKDPERLLREVRRVLLPGGGFLFHTPNASYFEVAIARHIPAAVTRGVASFLDGRGGDDIFPTHYRLNKAHEIVRLAAESGLATRFVRHVECTAQGVMLGPLVIFELLVIRMLRLPILENYRSDLIVMLEKPGDRVLGRDNGEMFNDRDAQKANSVMSMP
jgi:SAM-dependent methyltransferase